jgi:hypothetical protein
MVRCPAAAVPYVTDFLVDLKPVRLRANVTSTNLIETGGF